MRGWRHSCCKLFKEKRESWSSPFWSVTSLCGEIFLLLYRSLHVPSNDKRRLHLWFDKYICKHQMRLLVISLFLEDRMKTTLVFSHDKHSLLIYLTIYLIFLRSANQINVFLSRITSSLWSHIFSFHSKFNFMRFIRYLAIILLDGIHICLPLV